MHGGEAVNRMFARHRPEAADAARWAPKRPEGLAGAGQTLCPSLHRRTDGGPAPGRGRPWGFCALVRMHKRSSRPTRCRTRAG